MTEPHQLGVVYSYSAKDPEIIIPVLLSQIGTPNLVVDLGGGNGAWSCAFKREGVAKVRCIDNPKHLDSDALLVSSEEFIGVDLLNGMPKPSPCDLAVCLEFVEHLPERMAGDIVEFLTKSADVVLFSAAIPGQPGHGHVNCKPPAYWQKLFGANGHRRFDSIRNTILTDSRLNYWYRQNMYLFVNEKLLGGLNPTWFTVPRTQTFVPDDFELVHEKILRAYRAEDGVKTLIRKLPQAVGKAFKRRFFNS